jgi:tetratricopeptide (TPR) repeat protein
LRHPHARSSKMFKLVIKSKTMKRALLPVLSLAIIALFAGVKLSPHPADTSIFNHDVSVCGGGFTSIIQPGANGKYIPLMSGTGHHHYAVHTSSDSAQIYFDQGFSFYYGYHFSEALASFKEAARFDRSCMMAYWGQALALGPYFNSYTYKMSSEVPAVLQSIQRTNSGASAKENDLSQAMLQRFSQDTTNADRPQLDLNYAKALRPLVDKYPRDYDVKLLYIDAVMLCHKWDFWHTDRTPKPWTPELVTRCEEVLKAEPQNAGAIHYYIHLTEASDHPEKALPYADELQTLMPGVSHIVHMASHSYMRNGLFAKGVTDNEEAYRVYVKEDAVSGMHLSRNIAIHTFAVQSFCALGAGMYQHGMPLYQRVRNLITAMKPDFKSEPYAQFVYMIPEMAMVRFGKWAEVMKETRPAQTWKYALVMDDFAKGMAQVHQNDLSGANRSLTDLKASLSDGMLAIRRMPYNKPSQSGEIARDILAGEILYAEGNAAGAIAVLQKAVQEEDALIYREPAEWLLPARQYLGHYLLKMNKAAQAEQVYRQDLVANPGNGWSLVGLFYAAKTRHDNIAAASYVTKYRQAFASADIEPPASVY